MKLGFQGAPPAFVQPYTEDEAEEGGEDEDDDEGGIVAHFARLDGFGFGLVWLVWFGWYG